jgi:hypothetical protein
MGSTAWGVPVRQTIVTDIRRHLSRHSGPISRMITSSHEGAAGQVVLSGRCTICHERHRCALLGCGGGVKGHSPRERVAEGEPLRPLPQPSHTQNAVRRRPWFTLPILSVPSSGVTCGQISPSGISLRLGSSPFVGCGTNAAEPHIRSPRRRLTPKFLIPEVIGLGRAGPIFITACRSQDIMRSARRDPARAIGSCGWRDALSGR